LLSKKYIQEVHKEFFRGPFHNEKTRVVFPAVPNCSQVTFFKIMGSVILNTPSASCIRRRHSLFSPTNYMFSMLKKEVDKRASR